MTNAPRITNLCYPRGSVVYAKFEKNSEYYYLNMRPLIVVSIQNQMFDSLTVIGCGSRDRPGIEVSLFNHRLGHWIGNHQFSVAQPYAIFSIIASQIVEFHGVIDPWTMDAIDKAMAFHLGLSKEVPPYMQDIYKDMMAPAYSMGTEENTQLKDPHQFGSVNEQTRTFLKIPSKMANTYDNGKPYPKKNEPVKFKPNVNTTEKVQKRIKRKEKELLKEKLNITSDMTDEVKEPITPEVPEIETPEPETPLCEEPVTIEFTATTKNSVKNKRIGTADLYIPDEDDDNCIYDDTLLNIVASMNEYDRLKFIIRKAEAGKYGDHQQISVYANQIGQIRKAIEYTYGLTNGSFASKMKDRLCHQQRNFRFLSNFEKVACIIYGTPDQLGLSQAIYNDVAKSVIRENRLVFEDGRSWRNLANFDALKKIYQGTKKK